MRPAHEIQRSLELRGLYGLAVEIAAERYIEIDAMFRPGRSSDVTGARHELWRAMHDLGLSYPVIGRIFGMDHSTVCTGARSAAVRSARTTPPPAAVCERGERC